MLFKGFQTGPASEETKGRNTSAATVAATVTITHIHTVAHANIYAHTHVQQKPGSLGHPAR